MPFFDHFCGPLQALDHILRTTLCCNVLFEMIVFRSTSNSDPYTAKQEKLSKVKQCHLGLIIGWVAYHQICITH